MNAVETLVSRLCPNGVPHLFMGEVGEFIRGSGLQKADLRSEGTPAIHYGQIHTHYGAYTAETISFVEEEFGRRLCQAGPGDVILATTSEDDVAVAKATAWLGEGNVVISGDAHIFRHTLDAKYVSYFIHSRSFQSQKLRYITGAKVRRISGASLGKIRIPVPPLEVQREIVSILDNFTQLESELESELEARQAQFTHYRNQLLSLSPDMEWATLGEVAQRVSTGATPRARNPRYYQNGTIPWLRTNEVRFNDIWATEMQITQAAVDETAVNWIPANCVIIAISGATAARSAINRIPLTTNQHCCNLEIDPAKAYFRYVFHWVSANYEELKAHGRGARSDLNVSIIKSLRIPLPDLDTQKQVADQLDTFQKLVGDLDFGLPAEIAARRKQYEYYRDKLLAFEEAS